MFIKSFVKELTLADILLICLVILAVVFTTLHFSSDNKALSAYIYKNGSLLGVYPLAKAQTITIDEHNSVEIKQGKVRMSHSDCPDERCVRQGYSDNMPIICLPNRVMIEIKGSAEEKKLILY